MNTLIATTIELFQAVVAETTEVVLSHVREGFVTDFAPTREQLNVLREKFKSLPIVTLFTVRERETASLEELLTKQILHYIEVYGLAAPGLFNLEVRGGEIQTIAFIKAVSQDRLGELVRDLLYSNRPVKDVAPIIDLIRGYKIAYSIDKVQNNELKVALFDTNSDTFQSGDDAVRYICYVATGSPMLIKSYGVIAAIGKKPVDERFLVAHQRPLSKVFNRHKRIIMACKTKATKSIINKISKLSKRNHVPLVEPLAKRFVSEFIHGNVKASALAQISLRDKFKYLNLIEWKLLGKDYDTFIIRNGKVWFEKDRKVATPGSLLSLQAAILESVKLDPALERLRDKHILLDPYVDYGLPISRKQTLGRLPFGTKVVASRAERFSAGVYWHNNFGDGSSIDLDLTAIKSNGERTGWGGLRAYAAEDIVFSGDMSDARDGAIEFMTVNPQRGNRYGLMVNIFRGPEPCGAEIVVGHGTKESWQGHTLIREKISLESKQALIGFLKDDAFVVYGGRLSNSRVSTGKHPVIDKGLGTLWTVKALLKASGVEFDTTPQPQVVYDHDLRYESFSLDKLESLLAL
jgi:hypothetical protein